MAGGESNALQQARLLSIFTPLGEDVLLIQSLVGREAVSGLFAFEAELLADRQKRKDAQVNADQLVGAAVTVSVQLGDGQARYFNGIIRRFVQGGRDERFVYYRAEIVPTLWRLTLNADCRIFQDQSVPDIIKRVLQDAGLQDVRFSLSRTYTSWDYCVQYRETDFNFISRLMEHEGICYFFTHEQDKHILVLADAPAAHRPCPNQPAARYEPEGVLEGDEDAVTALEVSKDLRPGKQTRRDFHFMAPSKVNQISLNSIIQIGQNSQLEIFDFPGEYAQQFNQPEQRLGQVQSEGETLIKVRTQEEETLHLLLSGESNCRAFTTGTKFNLTNHFKHNNAYLLTAIEHAVEQSPSYVSEELSAAPYRNRFTSIPASVPFRPPRATPKPIVQGPQTAFVVGPAGEEIYTDKYGRVKVQFHWDRQAKNDENSSCWVRVSQNWAGKRWGAFFLPRIGQEVIVDFLEGDPDQPIITGRVYNAESMPPYTLPDEMTKSTIKSLSSKGGGGFNEIRFEDKKGSEQVFIHAEKQQDNRVKQDSLEWVGGARSLMVGGDQLEQVAGDKHLSVKGDQNEKVKGTVSLDVGMDLEQKVAMKHALDAGQEIHLKSGMNLVIESGATLTLKVGGNFININPGGVFISGTMVMINSGGSAGSGAGASPAAPKDPAVADKGDPGSKDAPPAQSSQPRQPTSYSPLALALQQAAQNGTPFCDI